MKRSRTAVIGILSCATGLFAGCNATQHADQSPEPAAARSVGLMAGDAIGRRSFADHGRIAWAPDLPWMPSYRSVVQQNHRPTATTTVQVDTDR